MVHSIHSARTIHGVSCKFTSRIANDANENHTRFQCDTEKMCTMLIFKTYMAVWSFKRMHR